MKTSSTRAVLAMLSAVLLLGACAETQVNEAQVIDRSGRTVPPVTTVTGGVPTPAPVRAPASVPVAPVRDAVVIPARGGAASAAVAAPSAPPVPLAAASPIAAPAVAALADSAVGTVATDRGVEGRALEPIAAAPLVMSAPPPTATDGKLPAPAPATAPAAAPAGPGWAWPVAGRVAARFDGQGSRGIEIAVAEDAPVVAVADGEVSYKGSPREYGNLVIVRHGDDLLSVYAFNREVLVEQGQKVTRGQAIARAGSTPGRGPLLHFEVRRKGVAIDPLTLLPAP